MFYLERYKHNQKLRKEAYENTTLINVNSRNSTSVKRPIELIRKWEAADYGPLALIACVVGYFVYVYIEQFGLSAVANGLIAIICGLLVFIRKIGMIAHGIKARSKKDKYCSNENT